MMKNWKKKNIEKRERLVMPFVFLEGFRVVIVVIVVVIEIEGEERDKEKKKGD